MHLLQKLEYISDKVRAHVFKFDKPKSKLVTRSASSGTHTQRCRFQECQEKATRYADMCDAHAKNEYKAEIKTSTISNAGYGLFAAGTFDEGDFIDLYCGKYIPATNKVLPYGFKLQEHNCIIDASSSQSCIARYINHDPIRCNCMFKRFQPQEGITLVSVITTQKVEKGQEFFIDYGSEYANAKVFQDVVCTSPKI